MCIRDSNNYLRSVYGIDPVAIEATHQLGQQRLFATIRERTGVELDPHVLTLGFARRVATYKRITLLFRSPERLVEIAERIGGLQIVFAGKAHPADNAGKALIREVFTDAAKLNSSSLKILYLENYDWELGEQLTGGVDVWLNTPLRPYEMCIRDSPYRGLPDADKRPSTGLRDGSACPPGRRPSQSGSNSLHPPCRFPSRTLTQPALRSGT